MTFQQSAEFRKAAEMDERENDESLIITPFLLCNLIKHKYLCILISPVVFHNSSPQTIKKQLTETIIWEEIAKQYFSSEVLWIIKTLFLHFLK